MTQAKQHKGKVYLIPTTLGDMDPSTVISKEVYNIIDTIHQFVVENEKTARRYLKKLGITTPLNDLILLPLNKHTSEVEFSGYLKVCEEGKNVGIISEAGCPGIADPGAEVVRIAHQKKLQVIPLVGPSSILMALMASGFNGQSFVFHGYLPIEKADRIKKIKELEENSYRLNQTQLFIETPFRNNALFSDIMTACRNNTLLCIACNITLEDEFIVTKNIESWKHHIPDIQKKPALFLISRA